MAENPMGYHIWELSADYRVWRMLERVGRRQQWDDKPVSTPGHWESRSGATEYARRNLRGKRIRVAACTWPDCAFEHLPDWIERRPEAEIEQVRCRKLNELRRRNSRRRERELRRRREFEAAVDRAVAERLAGLGR